MRNFQIFPTSKQSTADDIEQLQGKNEYKYSIEEVLDKMAGNMSYQYKITLFFFIHSVLNGMMIYTSGMMFQKPLFQCEGQYCSHKQYCNTAPESRNVQLNSFESIAQGFQLYCEYNYLNQIGSALPFLGGMIGQFVGPWISDNYGRKASIGLTWLIVTIGGLFIVSFDNILFILIGFFLSGLGHFPTLILDTVFLSELSNGKFRTRSQGIVFMGYGFGLVVVYPLTMITGTWFNFICYGLFIPYLIMNFVYFYILESPKFTQRRNLEKTADIINKISCKNGSNFMITADQIEKPSISSQQNQTQKYSYMDLLIYPSLRKQVICNTIVGIGINSIYFGLQFCLDLISQDVAKTICIVGIADFLGYTIAGIVGPTWQRKKGYCVTFAICLVFMCSFGLDPIPADCLPETQNCVQKQLQIGQSWFAFIFLAISFSLFCIWRIEMTPGSVRSLSVGATQGLSTGFVYLMPYIKEVFVLYEISFFYFLVVCGAIGLITSIYLEETLDKPLLDEIEEIQENSLHSPLMAKNIRTNSQQIFEMTSVKNWRPQKTLTN